MKGLRPFWPVREQAAAHGTVRRLGICAPFPFSTGCGLNSDDDVVAELRRTCGTCRYSRLRSLGRVEWRARPHDREATA